MTLDEFLTDYVPNVLKPMGEWGFIGEGTIDRGGACVLTAERDRGAWTWGAEAARLGITVPVARVLMNAADFPPEDLGLAGRAIRARLLAGLGLSEPGGERGSR